MASTVVLDIETVGFPWEGFPPETQEYLLKHADSTSEEERTKSNLSLWAPTAKLVVIGLLNPDTKRAMILSEGSQSQEPLETQHGKFLVSHFYGDESALLNKFWELIPSYEHYITFNGKGFDCPFIMLRSLIQGIAPTRHLDTRRYTIKPHLDLLEVLSFFGATRKFTLQFWCQTLGIGDPKAQFGDGSHVQEAYHQGRMEEIIAYNLADLEATVHLYEAVNARLLSTWEKR